jgi:hypothetical protein
MAVIAKLHAERSKVLYQEDLRLTARLRNDSETTLRSVNPGDIPCWPRLVVSQPDAEDRTYSKPLPPGDPGYAVEVRSSHAQGRSFWLSDFTELPGPGRYELRSEYEWWDGGLAQATSGPVVLDVLPAKPRKSSLAPAAGAWSSAWKLLWLNQSASNQYQICLSEFRSSPRTSIHTAVLSAVPRPVDVAVGVANGVRSDVCGWFDGNVLAITRGDRIQRYAVPPSAKRLLPPLLACGEIVNALFSRGVEAKGTTLTWVTLESDGSPKSRHLALRGIRVLWLTSVIDQSGKCYTFLLTDGPAETVLMVCEWTIRHPPESFTPLASYPGRFAAAEALLFPGESVRGAVLLQSTQPDGPLKLQPWQWAPGTGLTAPVGAEIKLPEGFGLDMASVGVGPSAEGSILRSLEPDRLVYFADSRGVRQIPAPPLEVPTHFVFGAASSPLLLHGTEGLGWQWIPA